MLKWAKLSLVIIRQNEIERSSDLGQVLYIFVHRPLKVGQLLAGDHVSK